MKILAIMAGPRKGGNVDRMLDLALEGASSQGAEVIKVVLSEKNILPCNGCMACRNTSRCKIEDDMQGIYDMLYDCTGYIIGSPIYHQNVSCYLKTFFDRITGKIVTYRRGKKYSRLPQSRLLNKRALVVTSMNASFPVSIPYLKNFRRAVYSFTDYAHIEVVGFVSTQNTWLRKPQDFFKEDRKAFEWGSRLVTWKTPLATQVHFAWSDFKISSINRLLDLLDPPS